MKVEELRIGNWAKRDSQPEGFVIDIHSLVRIANGRTDYQPIPLTEEWLLKLGFEKWGDCRYNIHTQFVSFTSEGLNFDGNDLDVYNDHPIKYVHQLQNLYFALTGEELIIKNQ